MLFAERGTELRISPLLEGIRTLSGEKIQWYLASELRELWRSRYDTDRNVIVVNNGHRDFVFATRNRALQLRYLVRLYVKELVLKNFSGISPEQLLERMIELSLYAEEKLKTG